MQEGKKHLIVGLGNPGYQYSKSRHNVGFMIVDTLARELDVSIERKKFQSLYERVHWKGQELILVKPQTYMNLSGKALREILDYFDFPLSSLMVVCDDLHLPLGTLRFKRKGSAGGHNGVQSIIDELNTTDFARLKVGIGEPGRMDQVNFVLGNFTEEEWETIESLLSQSSEALKSWMKKGLDYSMGQYN